MRLQYQINCQHTWCRRPYQLKKTSINIGAMTTNIFLNSHFLRKKISVYLEHRCRLSVFLTAGQVVNKKRVIIVSSLVMTHNFGKLIKTLNIKLSASIWNLSLSSDSFGNQRIEINYLVWPIKSEHVVNFCMKSKSVIIFILNAANKTYFQTLCCVSKTIT